MTERRWVKLRRENNEQLTAVEAATLELVALGHTDRAISRQMAVPEATVKSRVQRVLVVLDAHSRAGAVHNAHLRGWLGLADPEGLRDEIEQLKRTNAGQRTRARAQAQVIADMQKQLEEQAELAAGLTAEIQRLGDLNRRLGNESAAWLDSSQGRL